MEDVKLILDCKNILGEGILWNEKEACLYWTDIEGSLFYRYEPGTEDLQTFVMPERLCSFAFRESGGFLMAFASGLALYDLQSGIVKKLNPIKETVAGTRLNDGRCDRNGRFIVGDFDPEEKGRGNAYSINTDGSYKKLFGDLNSANSTCFSPDGSIMYYSCAEQGEIWFYDYDQKNSDISNKQLFHCFKDQPGLPDGSIIDSQGYLWNAQWAGSRVVRFAPDGTVDRVVELPVPNVTCLCFGGKELETLYITTARFTLSDEDLHKYPSAGGLFAVKMDVKGLKESRFKG
ncbi:MAG: SMP-30/gluconolactonase/LRE family protein [Spirochaetaceae bacterium]|nr:SMP-30/gluconolactonase/LRE family protein [Spirochaetaceae bacterium]